MPRRLRSSPPVPKITDTSQDQPPIPRCLLHRQPSDRATTFLRLRRPSQRLQSSRATLDALVAVFLSLLSRSQPAQARAACTRTGPLGNTRQPALLEKLVAHRLYLFNPRPPARPHLRSSRRKSPTALMEFPLPRLVRAIISFSHSRQTKVMYRFQWTCRLRRKWLMRSESATPEPRHDSGQGERRRKEKPRRQLLASNNKSAKPTRTSNTTSESATTSLSSSTRPLEATDTSPAHRPHGRVGYPCKLRAVRELLLGRVAHQPAALLVLALRATPISEANKGPPNRIGMSADVRAPTFRPRAQRLVNKPSLKLCIHHPRIRLWLLHRPHRGLVRLQARCNTAYPSNPSNRRLHSQVIRLRTHLSGTTGAGLLSRLLGAVHLYRLQDSTNSPNHGYTIVHTVHIIHPT